MSKQIEALKMALECVEAWDRGCDRDAYWRDIEDAVTAIKEAMAEQPAQQQEPAAYDKTEINCFAQDLYDQKMREGKRGHYESMFHVIHQCIKKVSPPASKQWVGLTDKELDDLWVLHHDHLGQPKTSAQNGWAFERAIEAKIKEKNT